jgi:hypothetical protein
MIERPDRRTITIALIALVVVASGVGIAQTFLLTAGQGSAFDNPDGVKVTLGEDLGLSGANPQNSDGSITIQNTTIDGPAGSAVTLTSPSSDAPTLSSINTNGGTITAETDGIQTVEISGSVTELTYRQADLQSSSTEFDVSGVGTVGIHGFNSGQAVRVEFSDGSSDLIFADSSGVLSVTASDESFTLVQPNEGLQLSNPEPVNDNLVLGTPPNLSVDVSHGDFDAGESVDLQFSLNGESLETVTVSQNQTVTVNATGAEGGSNNWSVTATDSQGNQFTLDESDGLTFQLPNELEIRSETQPDTLIDTNNVTLEFYFESEDDLIAEREADGGTIDMAGLPVTQSFTVVANAEGYHSRRIFVDDLTEQQEIYLLNESVESVNPEFELTDFTGLYPTEDTVLRIQRNIQGDWKTAQGDFFGATGAYRTTLRYNQEHRLRLVNVETGRTRDIGRYTPTRSVLETIEVTSQDTIILEQGAPLITSSPSTRSFTALQNQRLTMDIQASDSDLEEISMTVTYVNGSQTEELANVTRNDADDITIERELDLTNKSDGRLEVDVAWSTVDGESGVRSFEYSIREVVDQEFGLLSTLASIPDRLATNTTGEDGGGGGSAILVFASILLTVMGTASATAKLRLSTEAAGIVSLLFLAGFWVIAWVPGSVVFAAIVTYATLAAARRQL